MNQPTYGNEEKERAKGGGNGRFANAVASLQGVIISKGKQKGTACVVEMVNMSVQFLLWRVCV